jgi:murein DD-endopeptidase MepM/ murein hydrolase activator NlpD
MKISTRITDLFSSPGSLKNLIRKRKIQGAAAFLAVAVIISAVALSGGGQDVTAANAEAKAVPEAPILYAIEVDGEQIVALETRGEAQAVLTGVVNHYKAQGSELVAFDYTESVNIVEVTELTAGILPVDQAITLIVTGTQEPKTYAVVSGDTLWDISDMSGMSVDALIAANPAVNPDRLKIGESINLYEIKPYLHLRLTERVAALERIEYPVSYEETSTLYKGEVKVKTEGTFGQRQVVTELVRENGIVVASIELESQVVSEPKVQVMLKGTKSLSTLVGTGSFVSPMGHLEISSPYGSRGGGRHTGVDFRNPKGTPIYVVDDGVVTFAAYQGSYGNLVRVSHGKGIETWYAHCDKILVSVGTMVRKGDQIATVGATGRATGYHLHFEVRINGVPTNPMPYM